MLLTQVFVIDIAAGSGVNELIARQANQEDNGTGRLREGRFKSHTLPNAAAVLACMTYVDLSPIRALEGNERMTLPDGCVFDGKDYVTLVDDTGRMLCDDKRGVIQPVIASILARLKKSSHITVRI